jgi:outer membrane protein TolC
MKRLSYYIFLFFILSCGLQGQNVLEQYIREGLENNLALQQKEFSFEKSQQALREAKGMFLPALGIEARYSAAGGGRTIDFPLGDLMNPIHQTLNQLLEKNGLQPVFPGNLENSSFPFFRPREQDTRLRLVQPIFQPALYFNKRIKAELSGAENAGYLAFARQLVAEIKTAYFNHLKTVSVKGLLDETRLLLEENVRISKALFDNQNVTEEVLFRSKAELSKLEQQRLEAEKNVTLSSSYFNFLLNRSLAAPIAIQEKFLPLFPNDPDSAAMESSSLQQREELQQLNHAISAAGNHVKLNQSSILPGIAAVIDYGFQGETYRFSKKDDYWMASLVLNWNLFNGFQDSARKKQALLEKKILEKQFQEAEVRIRLQLLDATRSLQVARQVLTAAAETQRSAEASFAIVSKKYEQQMVPQIEYIQARNECTAARTGQLISLYDLYIKEAQLELAAGLYPLVKKEK